MEWSRVKSIMIGIFCIVNIFLLSSYVNTMKTSVIISEDAIQNTVSVLANNNVLINKDIIPRKTQDIRTFDTINKFDNTRAMTDYFWSIAQKENLDFFNPQYVEIMNNSFQYKNNTATSYQILSESTAHAYSKKIVTRLELDTGMNLESYILKSEDIFIVTFHQVYEGNHVLDTRLVFELSEHGIIGIYGENWLCDEVMGGGLASIRSITEILVNFAITAERENPLKLIDIKLGYFIGDRGGVKSKVTVVPVWRLTTEDGKNYYYDAINGDLL